MAQHRHRQHKVKREHTIIEGLLPLLLRAAELEEVTSITPGRINPRTRSGDAGLFFQYQTETGLKLIGRSKTAVQEVFIVTADPAGALDALVKRGLVHVGKTPRHDVDGVANEPGEQNRKAAQGKTHKDKHRAEHHAEHIGERAFEAKGGSQAKIGRIANGTPRVERRAGAPAREQTAGGRAGEPAREHKARPFAENHAGGQPHDEPTGLAKERQGRHSRSASAKRPGKERPAENQKVEPKLWNELVRLHQELLELEKSLGHLSPSERGER